jgi:signal transduction histidine kinase
LRQEETDLATIIQSAVETSQPVIEALKHQLAITIPEAPIPLHGDVLRLSQVFANLLHNAAKYTDAGGKIDVAARQEAGEVVLSVRDTGIGIWASVLAGLFDLFAQADRSSARSRGGLGIGQTLVKKLVEMHGGTVSAHSQGLGRGSEFCVGSPLASLGATPTEHLRALRPAVAPCGGVSWWSTTMTTPLQAWECCLNS